MSYLPLIFYGVLDLTAHYYSLKNQFMNHFVLNWFFYWAGFSAIYAYIANFKRSVYLIFLIILLIYSLSTNFFFRHDIEPLFIIVFLSLLNGIYTLIPLIVGSELKKPSKKLLAKNERLRRT